MIFFEMDNLCSVLGGRVLHKPKCPLVLQGVGIDSREDLSRKVFLAIKGPRFDGHDYLRDAIEAGAQLLVVERDPQWDSFPPLVGVVQVDDTRKSLGKLAAAYRKTLRGTQVIAVVGSAGKTTTKRLIDAALSGTMRGSISPKSFNNDIGVPLTILNAPSTDRYVVVEIGTNAIGEVPHLAKMAEPDIAVITMIGREHLEGLGSLENIAAENAGVLRHLQARGFAAINADAPLLRQYARVASTCVLFGEADDAEMRLTARGMNNGGVAGWWFEVNGRTRYQLSLPGKHNAINALAAVAVARRMGVQDQHISEGLARATGAPMRMAIERIAGITIFNDAYNANPDSMIAALETFVEVAPNVARRIVIIGDMLELGELGPECHRETGRKILEIDRVQRIDHVIAIGELMHNAADELATAWPKHRITRVKKLDQRAERAIAELFEPGDAVLLKGSRGMALERVIKAIQHQFAPLPASTSMPANAHVEPKKAKRSRKNKQPI